MVKKKWDKRIISIQFKKFIAISFCVYVFLNTFIFINRVPMTKELCECWVDWTVCVESSTSWTTPPQIYPLSSLSSKSHVTLTYFNLGHALKSQYIRNEWSNFTSIYVSFSGIQLFLYGLIRPATRPMRQRVALFNAAYFCTVTFCKSVLPHFRLALTQFYLKRYNTINVKN